MRKALRATLPGFICISVLGGILVAGLHPFHAPKNDIVWSIDGNGLHFGQNGTVLSAGSFQQPSGCCNTLEIWLQVARLDDTNTFLAFYIPGKPVPFSLHQSGADLLVRRDNGSPSRMFADKVFRRAQPVFITITNSPTDSAIYVDGLLAKTSTQPGSGEFSGQLILGNSPRENDSWSGDLLGLAIYGQTLSPAQVRRHRQTWTETGQPEIGDEEHPVALYLFDERRGSIVFNKVHGVNLHIPERYTTVDQVLLKPFWKEFDFTWGFWKNVIINVLGFIPLGFFFRAYFSSVRGNRVAAMATILLGFAVSLTIEVLQGFLPTRQSGTADLITNTLGTCIGVLLHRFSPNVVRVNLSHPL